jgi:peroxiredoxin
VKKTVENPQPQHPQRLAEATFTSLTDILPEISCPTERIHCSARNTIPMLAPLTELPSDLPRPEDDGCTSHLIGMRLPAIKLRATSGLEVDLSTLEGTIVIFAYPMTGEPGKALPTDWISIPGAAGCTLETCGFRDHYDELSDLGCRVFGLSTQPTQVQLEAKRRLGLQFEIMSDCDLGLTRSLRLPMMEPDGIPMIKRITLVCEASEVLHVFYPVFPPDKHADEVVTWIQNNKKQNKPCMATPTSPSVFDVST